MLANHYHFVARGNAAGVNLAVLLHEFIYRFKTDGLKIEDD